MRADGCGASELSCGRSVVIHLPEVAEISSFTTEKGFVKDLVNVSSDHRTRVVTVGTWEPRFACKMQGC